MGRKKLPTISAKAGPPPAEYVEAIEAVILAWCEDAKRETDAQERTFTARAIATLADVATAARALVAEDGKP